jgi:hypothetical protein
VNADGLQLHSTPDAPFNVKAIQGFRISDWRSVDAAFGFYEIGLERNKNIAFKLIA